MSSRHRAIARYWQTSGKWTPTWMVQHMPSTISVKVSQTSQSFMYTEEMQRHLLPDDPKRQSITRLEEMSPTDMFEKMERQENAEQPEWMYFTCKCEDLSADVLEAAQGWQQLCSDHRLSDAVGNPEHPSVWMGGKGTSTTAHYDVMDNVFVQLYGRKKFRLWGADAMAQLHVFPDVHPRARKSQIEDIAELAQLCPPKTEIILEPGDTLQIPAFTFHQVEALDLSLSVNVFSVCRTQMHGGRILSTPLPLMQVVGQSTKCTDVGLVLSTLVKNTLPLFGIDAAPADYIIQNLLATRHRMLVGSPAMMPTRKVGSCSEHYVGTFDQRQMETLSEWWAAMRRDMVTSDNYIIPDEVNGVRDIIVSHLLESWALQLNNGSAERVHSAFESSVQQLLWDE